MRRTRKGWRADDLREAEASDVAAAIRQTIAEGWPVFDDGMTNWRPARWNDLAVLLPARTSLPILERALERAGVPYRAETSSLVYGTREVRDLLLIARAVEDPTDSLAVVAALRTAAFGCGDDDLYDWRKCTAAVGPPGPSQPDARPPTTPSRGVWRGWATCIANGCGCRRVRSSTGSCANGGCMEMAFVHRRPRDLWRRLRFVVDQCRAWEEAGGATLRDYLSWVKLQSASRIEGGRDRAPRDRRQAVRILTIHGAKGLEFPITVLSGMTSRLRDAQRGVQVLFPPAYRVGAASEEGPRRPSEFKDLVPIEEQMDHHERCACCMWRPPGRATTWSSRCTARRTTRSPTAAGLFYDKGWDPALVEVLQLPGARRAARHGAGVALLSSASPVDARLGA